MSLAKESRFQAYLKLLPAQQRLDIEEGVLRENWLPFRLRETHEGLLSVWDAAAQEHQSRLAEVAEEIGATGVKERLRDLCMKPALPTTKLRQRTTDESKAIVMIVNHEIEVPFVPHFLQLSRTTSELAVLEDIFMALEYQLYAHLAPG
jgi:hypothetical protein